jgi:hypothetical protein
MQTVNNDLFVRLNKIAAHYRKAPSEVLSDFIGVAESIIGEKPMAIEPVKTKKKARKMSASHRKAISVGRRLAHARKVLAGIAAK